MKGVSFYRMHNWALGGGLGQLSNDLQLLAASLTEFVEGVSFFRMHNWALGGGALGSLLMISSLAASLTEFVESKFWFDRGWQERSGNETDIMRL